MGKHISFADLDALADVGAFQCWPFDCPRGHIRIHSESAEQGGKCPQCGAAVVAGPVHWHKISDNTRQSCRTKSPSA